MNSLYERDFYAWTGEQADLLHAQRRLEPLGREGLLGVVGPGEADRDRSGIIGAPKSERYRERGSVGSVTLEFCKLVEHIEDELPALRVRPAHEPIRIALAIDEGPDHRR